MYGFVAPKPAWGLKGSDRGVDNVRMVFCALNVKYQLQDVAKPLQPNSKLDYQWMR
jgi:hypothetical protein